MKKRKVGEEGPMYTHSDFRTSASVRARTAVINVKRASVLDLLSQATYIRSEKFKKQTPPNMARGNQISNAVGTGLKAHSGGPEAHHYNAEFGCREENQSCSEGYPELIYSFMDVLACTHGRRTVTGITGRCGPKAHNQAPHRG